MDSEKKKVFLILAFAVLVFGTLIWWLVSPIISLQGKDLASEEGADKSSFYDQFAQAGEATAREEAYLEGVNQPTEASITDADESESLGLIKGGEGLYGEKSEKSKDFESSGKYEPKVSTLGALREKMGQKLPRLSGMLGFGSGGGRGGYGGSGGFDPTRFGKKGLQGGNVAAGPAAAKGLTKFKGGGKRDAPDSKFSYADAAAKGAAGKFGENQLARAVDPKVSGTGDGKVPKDFSPDPNAKKSELQQPKAPERSIKNPNDQCGGDAITKGLLGAGAMIAMGGAIAYMSGGGAATMAVGGVVAESGTEITNEMVGKSLGVKEGGGALGQIGSSFGSSGIQVLTSVVMNCVLGLGGSGGGGGAG